MNERSKQTSEKAAHFWELGILKFLRNKGFLTEDEYQGIKQIAEDDFIKNSYV